MLQETFIIKSIFLIFSTQATLRKANLSCKLSIDSKEKDELLGSRGILCMTFFSVDKTVHFNPGVEVL